MKPTPSIREAVALVAAAFLFPACSHAVDAGHVPIRSSVVVDGPHGGIHPDMTDLGGDLRQPDSPCAEGADQLYRYSARTIGGDARIDDFCVGARLDDFFVHQPPDELLGECPVESCGTASAARRGPMEPALLQSIASLEHGKALRLKEMSQRMEDDASDRVQVEVRLGTVKFQLAPGIQCVAQLEVFEERVESGGGIHSRTAAKATAHEEIVRHLALAGPTVSSGMVYLKQTKLGEVHTLLAIFENSYEGRHDAELVAEKFLCNSSAGPIGVSASPHYGFRVKRANRHEWMIQAFPVSSPVVSE